MTAAIIQLCIAAFGLTAVALALSLSPRARRWAPVVGLAGQPFWIAFALRADGWGVLALTVAYTLVYANGVRVQWLRREPRP